MSFLRPEATAKLMRWREVLICLGVLLVGLWMTQQPGPVVKAVGGLAALAAAGLGAIAVRRMRFGSKDLAPGLVVLDEGEITYLGPVAGGSIDLEGLSVLRLRSDGERQVWLLQSENGNALAIPHGAQGEDVLFDAFAVLPGLRMYTLLDALENPTEGSVVVWQRTKPDEVVRLTSPAQRDTS